MRIIASFLVQLAFASSHTGRPAEHSPVFHYQRDNSGEWRETIVR
jgi:hypothetical protein